jgi:putative transposase
MGREPRPVWAGASYHAMARGNNRQPVFLSDADREDFLTRLGQVAERHAWRCLAYCLMGNHFHLAVTTERGNLPEGMRDLLAGFARSSNRRNGRSGHVFGHRYTTVPICNDGQFESTIAYILNNPVRAGLVAQPEDWHWSSCAATFGLALARSFLCISDALDVFDLNHASARESLRRLMRDSVAPLEPSAIPASGIPPVASGGQVAHSVRPSLTEIFSTAPPAEALRSALALGYRQADVARHLGLTPQAVSYRARRLNSAA